MNSMTSFATNVNSIVAMAEPMTPVRIAFRLGTPNTNAAVSAGHMPASGRGSVIMASMPTSFRPRNLSRRTVLVLLTNRFTNA